MTPAYDVAVIGAGPAGAATALNLAALGVHCVVIESKPEPVWKIGETLAPESRQVLQSLAVWDDFVRQGHLPSWGAFSSWGRDGLMEKDFIFNPHGCGWQLDRQRFETFLQVKAQAAGASLWQGSPVTALQRDGDAWQLTVDKRTLRAQWLVDASGRASIVARQLGSRRLVLDQFVSIHAIASATHPGDEDARTYVEARPSGWWYSALMPGHRRTVAWQTDADLLPPKHRHDPLWLWKLAQEAPGLKGILDEHGYHFSGVPRLTSAQSARIAPACGQGWLAVGDAAQAYDPLTGQGLLHALRSGQRAATVLAENWPCKGEATAGYAQWLEDLWNRYLNGRKLTYQAEDRWIEDPFWKRRRSTSISQN